MSQCIVPNWNIRHQRQVVEGEDQPNRSSTHMHNHNHNHNSIAAASSVPMSSKYEVAELTWENGQLAMHGLGLGLGGGGGLLPTKPTWVRRASDTLESIVHQATATTTVNLARETHQHGPSQANMSSNNNPLARKRVRDSEQDQEVAERSACASASATFCNDRTNTMLTWGSFDSPWSLKTKTTEDDSACHDGSENRDEEGDHTKSESGRSHTTRRSRAAAIHNQSERRRRDRINQKMKALQKLVPNASKSDKASMLDEVIEYLKQLQAQVQAMNSMRNMNMNMNMHMNMPAHHPNHHQMMMMPLGMQQQQQMQMSLLARMGMGMGMGMGMLDMSPMAAAARTAPQFMVPQPQVIAPPQPSPDRATPSVPFTDPYSAFLAQQSMNMDLYSKMAALYRQQVNQTAPSQPNHAQED